MKAKETKHFIIFGKEHIILLQELNYLALDITYLVRYSNFKSHYEMTLCDGCMKHQHT